MAVAGGVSEIEDDDRELVRRRGLDPLTDPAAVSRLVAEVIVDYDERSLSGGVQLLTDPAAAARRVIDAVAGFGPLQRYLDDPTVEEVWITKRLTRGSRAIRCRAPASSRWRSS